MSTLQVKSGTRPWLKLAGPVSDYVTRGDLVKTNDLKSMSTDTLWDLHDNLTNILGRKIATEKAKLEERLRKIEAADSTPRIARARRPYPAVLPKYRNPKNRAESWSGRGKTPRWLKAQLRAGKKLDNFLIDRQQPDARGKPTET
jgi:DNA-binding protein H-NS